MISHLFFSLMSEWFFAVKTRYMINSYESRTIFPSKAHFVSAVVVQSILDARNILTSVTGRNLYIHKSLPLGFESDMQTEASHVLFPSKRIKHLPRSRARDESTAGGAVSQFTSATSSPKIIASQLLCYCPRYTHASARPPVFTEAPFSGGPSRSFAPPTTHPTTSDTATSVIS